MANGPQKPDHGGNFFMTPRKVINSVAWNHLSLRARAILQLFQSAHDGFNNGRIKMGIHQLGALIGNQNHAANARAVAELIEKGFLVCMSDADHHQSKVREYRLTFIPSGKAKATSPATHDYADWRPPAGSKRKFGGAKDATETEVSIAAPAIFGKFSGADSATSNGEIVGISASGCVAAVAPILGNQSLASSASTSISGNSPFRSTGEGIGVDLDELREWLLHVLGEAGFGGQKELSREAGVPEPVLSKFKRGRGLPAHYRIPLQTACGRRTPYNVWKAQRAGG